MKANGKNSNGKNYYIRMTLNEDVVVVAVVVDLNMNKAKVNSKINMTCGNRKS